MNLERKRSNLFWLPSAALLALSLMLNTVLAQQIPQFSQYMKNRYLINPGAAGQQDYIDVTAGGRLQWLGFSDAPKTMYVYASSTNLLK